MTERRDLSIALAALVTCAGAALYLGISISGHVGRVVDVVPYYPELAGSEHPAEVQAALGDGQGFLMLARDPLLSSPGEAGTDAAAYRASRPLVSYVTWILAAGDAARTAWALYAAAALTAGLAAGGVALLARRFGLTPLWALPTLAVLPGSYGSLENGGAELLMLAGVAAGVAIVSDVDPTTDRIPWAAVAAFTGATLARETALVFVLAAAAWFLSRGGRPFRFLVPLLAYAGWCLVVWWRYGAPTWGAPDGAFGFASFTSDASPANLATAAVVLVALMALVVRRDVWIWIAAANGLLFVSLGAAVWDDPADVLRVMLPVIAMGILAVVAGHRHMLRGTAHGSAAKVPARVEDPALSSLRGSR